jgi:hypothetical protein
VCSSPGEKLTMSHNIMSYELPNRPPDRGRATSTERRAVASTRLRPIRSLLRALRAAKDTGTHFLWIAEGPAKLFHEPGWVELQPHRDGAVLFLNRVGVGNQ